MRTRDIPYSDFSLLVLFLDLKMLNWCFIFELLLICLLQPGLSCSLKALHKKLIGRRVFHSENIQSIDWHNDHEVEHAVWKLMRMCGSEDTSCIRELVSDFVSRVFIFYILLIGNTLYLWVLKFFVPSLVLQVGIGDPHCVVFHLPGDAKTIHIFRPVVIGSASEIDFKIETGISKDLLVELLKHLKRYLMDDSVKIVDMTSQVLQVSLWRPISGSLFSFLNWKMV